MHLALGGEVGGGVIPWGRAENKERVRGKSFDIRKLDKICIFGKVFSRGVGQS